MCRAIPKLKRDARHGLLGIAVRFDHIDLRGRVLDIHNAIAGEVDVGRACAYIALAWRGGFSQGV